MGTFEHGVGHGFRFDHVGNLRNDVAQALDVLHVQGREHVDAGVEHFLHVLVTLGVTRAVCIRVRELVDQQQRGFSR